ncbi:MAG: 4'-phosphopantetheinyl transferase superfamily protein [Planctomycetota bacterium]|nr:4'-phosphopantetheinyl transferase superfamily protein [Planctomycetota bacterium]
MKSTPVPADTIETWPFLLDAPPPLFDTLVQSLTPAEQGKINQGIFPEIGRRSAVSRAGLRHILSSYLGVPPQEISLREGEHGKPSLAGEEISFNLSHTGGHALVAVSDQGQLGVDLEQIRTEAPIDELADRCFSPDEFKHWDQYSGQQRLISFFHVWAQKEAFLKAHGGGMTIPLKDFDCRIDPCDEVGLIQSRISGDADRTWRMVAGNMGEDLRYSIVWDGAEKSVRSRDPEEAGLNRW